MTHPTPCQRCGACCQAHVGLVARTEDLARWRREGREDILGAIRRAEEGAGMGDTAFVSACPFLVDDGEGYACAIYATRPRVCREFQPGGERCARAPGPRPGARRE